MRNRDRGKEAEKRVATYLGGKRIGLLGGEDVQHETFSIEVKSREKFVAKGWYDQCKKNAPKGKIPLVVVSLKSQPIAKGYAILRLEDLATLIDASQCSQQGSDKDPSSLERAD